MQGNAGEIIEHHRWLNAEKMIEIHPLYSKNQYVLIHLEPHFIIEWCFLLCQIALHNNINQMFP